MSVFLTGASGFVGSYLIESLKNEYSIIKSQRDSPILIQETIVIHLSGKAHDLKKYQILMDTIESILN